MSVFTVEDLESIPEPEQIYGNSMENTLDKITISTEDVESEIDRLKSQKSPGPDEIYARILKECKKEVSTKLMDIFNISLRTREVPGAWKTANVVPIFKKGDRSIVANYRPVSLTSTVGKLLESIIAKNIRDHLDKFNLIKDTQHGFRNGYSCLTNLLTFFSEVFQALDKDKAFDVIYLDFSKAFDRVPHRRLLKKVEAHGITGELLSWIKAWLLDRKQRVCINGKHSDWADVASGVPQGSVLGPLLFIIYINDLDNGVSSSISKFADDTKIGRIINSADDIMAPQRDLNWLSGWADK